MQEIVLMKYIFFLLTTFSFQFVLGVQVFNGFLTKDSSGFYFTPKTGENLYKIKVNSSEAQTSLDRLESGDFISGNGTLDTINKKLTVESIDYVGLQKLLGNWVGADGKILFKDFTTMRFTPRFRESKLDTSIAYYQKEFRYSVTPSDNNEWGLFLSDDRSTSFATVQFAGKKVIMKIFESESGKIVRTLKLERP